MAHVRTNKARGKKEKGKRKKARSARTRGGLKIEGKQETTLATGDTRSRTAEFESVEQALRRGSGRF
jgi:hypothetical protein